MSISRWDPIGDLISLREAMNNLLEESYVRPRGGAGQRGSLALDVRETPDSFVITTAVPGVRPDDVDITVLGDTLTIRAEHREESEQERGQGHRWLLKERRYGTFERAVTLPTTVKADQATADFKDGILTITLPKAEEAKPRAIKVRGGGTSARGAVTSEAQSQSGGQGGKQSGGGS